MLSLVNPWAPAWSTASSSGGPAHEGYGVVREGPDGGREDDQMARAPPLWEQAEKVMALKPGEEKALEWTL